MEKRCPDQERQRVYTKWPDYAKYWDHFVSYDAKQGPDFGGPYILQIYDASDGRRSHQCFLQRGLCNI